jgi:hypothetical protein
VFKPGNDPRRGRGPKKGAPNAGRPLDEWKAYLRSLVDSAASRDAIVAILTDPSHPAYARVLAWADERGWGKESQQQDVTFRDLSKLSDDELLAIASGKA